MLPSVRLASHTGVLVRVLAALLLIWVLANVPGKAVEYGQVLGPLLRMQEVQMEFQALGIGLAQLCLFVERTSV